MVVLGACCITKKEEERGCVTRFWFNYKIKLNLFCSFNLVKLNWYLGGCQLISSTLNWLSIQLFLSPKNKQKMTPPAKKKKWACCLVSLVVMIVFKKNCILPQFSPTLIFHSMSKFVSFSWCNVDGTELSFKLDPV
jgi:hypothetical protein